MGDTLYGSDDNHQKAEKRGVELVAPTMGVVNEERLSLADFQMGEDGRVLACPQGHAPAVVKKKKSHLVCFDARQCAECPAQGRCPVKAGKRFYYLR